MKDIKKQQQQDVQTEQEQNKLEQVKSEITVVRNADGTFTGKAGKQSHTTRKTMVWDF